MLENVLLRGALQAVPDMGRRSNVAGLAFTDPQLLANMRDMRLERERVATVVIPGELDQPVGGQHAPRIADQEVQDARLQPRQAHWFTSFAYFVGLQVD